MLSPSTRDAIRRLADARLLAPEAADRLLDALQLWHAVQSRLRLAFGKPEAITAAEGTPKAIDLAMRGLYDLDFDALVAKMEQMAAAVYALFRAQIEEPAQVSAHATTTG